MILKEREGGEWPENKIFGKNDRKSPRIEMFRKKLD